MDILSISYDSYVDGEGHVSYMAILAGPKALPFLWS